MQKKLFSLDTLVIIGFLLPVLAFLYIEFSGGKIDEQQATWLRYTLYTTLSIVLVVGIALIIRAIKKVTSNNK